MTIDEFCAEVPHLPTDQARRVFIYRESGWEWICESDDYVMMQRPDTIETMETVYILPYGNVVKNIH